MNSLSATLAQQLLTDSGTPLYVYFEETLENKIQELQKFVGVWKKTKFLYAIKANGNPHIVKKILAHGFGIDAVSFEEVQLALFSGADPKNILYTENNCTDDEMCNAMECGVLLNIGSLSRLKKFGAAFPGSNVCVRFNPNVGAASHATNITGGPDSKFGISFTEIETVQKIAREYNLHIVGIHQHIGSGWLSLEEPLLAMDVILSLASHFRELEFVDFGGGFGVAYKPDQTPLDLETLGTKLAEKFEHFCQEYGREIELRFEPGRYVVAEAGHLLTRVNTLKIGMNGKIFAGTDTGMNHLVRPAMYGSYHPIVNVSNPNGKKQKYDVVGNICECADFFAKDRELSEIREGDILDIQIAGAYGMSMASEYQFRSRPAEILIQTNGEVRVIRRRSSFEEMIQIFDV